MAELSTVIDAYLADRRARGFKTGTLRADKSVLRLLLADIGNIDSRRLRHQHMDAFWAARTTWSAGTMNRGRFILSSFFQWCRTRGYLPRDFDPLEGSKVIKVRPRDRVVIPQGEFSTIIESFEDDPRRRVVMAIGFYLFLRISEIQALRWRDVDLDGATIQVFRTKTTTLDTLPLCEELIRELRRWRLAYAGRVDQQVQPGWFLVPGYAKQGARYGTKGVKGFTASIERPYLPTVAPHLGWLVRSSLQSVDYYQPMEGGHTLRRSGAIALYYQLSSVGHDRAIRICQAMLGHASVSTTELYLRLDLDRKMRNDLLAGKQMFPSKAAAVVIALGGTHEAHARSH